MLDIEVFILMFFMNKSESENRW